MIFWMITYSTKNLTVYVIMEVEKKGENKMVYLVNREDVINALCILYEADDEKESYIELFNAIKPSIIYI